MRWLLDNVPAPSRPRQYEFARLNVTHTVLSKRVLTQLVRDGYVSGWDDPRMPTIAGMRRRGVPAPAIRDLALFLGISNPSSESALAAGLVMGVMIIPFVSSMADDSITAVPQAMSDGSLAMGATQWQTIWRVVVPAARCGITTAVMLGMGRAIGETMAVMMVTGNAARIPLSLDSLFKPARTMTATIAAEMGEVAQGSTHYHALFGIAIILFLLTFLINLLAASTIFKKQRRGGLR